MSKKQKMVLISVFIAVLAVAGIAAGILNYRETQAGKKHITVEVISERDEYSKVTKCISEEEYLGAFMRTFEGCEWEESEYGIYITGFDGMQQDLEEQYWWCITVNGEDNNLGADLLPLTEGDTYTFTLIQGW